MSECARRHRCDKRLQMTVRPYVQARLMSQEFMNLRLDGYVLALSDIYGAVRSKRDTSVRGPGGAGVWAPPSAFERNTKKYLIPSSDVWAVKLLVIKHMPVLVFGRDASVQGGIDPLDKVPTPACDFGLVDCVRGRARAVGTYSGGGGGGSAAPPSLLLTALRRPQHKIGAEMSDSSYLTSAYLDSDDYYFYHTRLNREEDARLVRLRWYSAVYLPPPKTTVFVERKTHHEGWGGEKSTKERFSMPQRAVMEHLTAGASAAPFIERAVADGGMTATEGQAAITLSQEVSALIMEHGSSPKIRTRYRRTAFQLATSNTVRISLDTELTFMKEDGWALWGKDAASRARETFAEDTAFRFPHAVLEIKLQDEPPAWVVDLLTSGLLTPVHKFSKFMSAIAILCARAHAPCPAARSCVSAQVPGPRRGAAALVHARRETHAPEDRRPARRGGRRGRRQRR